MFGAAGALCAMTSSADAAAVAIRSSVSE
jgi:hypothetical protein